MSMFSAVQLMDSNSQVSNEIILFHNFSLALLLFILLFVLFMAYMVISKNKNIILTYGSSNILELTWTVLPMFILFSLGLPSLYLMYFMESSQKYYLSYKSVGHQWYWSYENNDFYNNEMDAYMLSEDTQSSLRLLECDNVLTLPYNIKIRMIITSTDVIHAWTIPTMGIKMDAVPSRLNMLNIMSSYPGSFYSQCSEICGINHSFMPIHVEFISWDTYMKL